MTRKYFIKLEEAMALVERNRGDNYELYNASLLLREIFNAHGGAERYLFSEK